MSAASHDISEAIGALLALGQAEDAGAAVARENLRAVTAHVAGIRNELRAASEESDFLRSTLPGLVESLFFNLAVDDDVADVVNALFKEMIRLCIVCFPLKVFALNKTLLMLLDGAIHESAVTPNAPVGLEERFEVIKVAEYVHTKAGKQSFYTRLGVPLMRNVGEEKRHFAWPVVSLHALNMKAGDQLNIGHLVEILECRSATNLLKVKNIDDPKKPNAWIDLHSYEVMGYWKLHKEKSGTSGNSSPPFLSRPLPELFQSLSLYLVQNINVFVDFGGFEEMAKSIASNRELIPLSHMMLFIKMLLAMQTLLKHESLEKWRDSTADVFEACRFRLRNLEEDELKFLCRYPRALSHLTDGSAKLAPFEIGTMRAGADSQYAQSVSERLLLSVMLRFLRLDSIEARLFGLNNLIEAVRVHSQNLQRLSTQAKEERRIVSSYKLVGANWLLELLERENIIELLYRNRSVHTEILRGGSTIALFLAKERILSEDDLALIWTAGLHRDQESVQIIHSLMISLIPRLEKEVRRKFFRKNISKLGPRDFDEHGEMLRFIHQVTAAALKADGVVAKTSSAESFFFVGEEEEESRTNVPGNVETNQSVIVRDDSIHEDIDNEDEEADSEVGEARGELFWYGLPILWKFILDEGVEDTVERPLTQRREAIRLLVNLVMQDSACSSQRTPLINACVQNMRQGTSVPQSLEVLRRIIHETTNARNPWYAFGDTRKRPHEIFIEKLERRFGMIRFLCDDLKRYQDRLEVVQAEVLASIEKAFESHRRRNRGPVLSIDNYTPPGSCYTHLEQLSVRLDFLLFILTNSFLYLRVPLCRELWKVLVEKAYSSKSRDIALMWFGLAQASGLTRLSQLEAGEDSAANSTPSSPVPGGKRKLHTQGEQRSNPSEATVESATEDSFQILSKNSVLQAEVAGLLLKEEMQQMDVENLTPVALRVYQSFFMSINYRNKALKRRGDPQSFLGYSKRRTHDARALARSILRLGGIETSLQLVERTSHQLDGTDFLWEVALKAWRDEVGISAMITLVSLHVQVSRHLRKRHRLLFAFVNQCVRKIVDATQMPRAQELDSKKALRQARRASTLLKLFLLNFKQETKSSVFNLIIIPAAIGVPGSISRRDWTSVGVTYSFAITARKTDTLADLREQIADKVGYGVDEIVLRTVNNPCKQTGWNSGSLSTQFFLAAAAAEDADAGESQGAADCISTEAVRIQMEEKAKQRQHVGLVESDPFGQTLDLSGLAQGRKFTSADLSLTLETLEFQDWDTIKILDSKIEAGTNKKRAISENSEPERKHKEQQASRFAEPMVTQACEQSFETPTHDLFLEECDGRTESRDEDGCSSAMTAELEEPFASTAEISSFPGELMSSIFDKLFQILDPPAPSRETSHSGSNSFSSSGSSFSRSISNDKVATRTIWDSIVLMVPDEAVMKRISRLEVPWNTLLPSNSTHRLLYTLLIINKELRVEHPEILPERWIWASVTSSRRATEAAFTTDPTAWSAKFVEQGGLAHLVGILNSYDELMGGRRTECLSELVRTISVLLFNDKRFRDRISSFLPRKEAIISQHSGNSSDKDHALTSAASNGGTEEGPLRKLSQMVKDHGRRFRKRLNVSEEKHGNGSSKASMTIQASSADLLEPEADFLLPLDVFPTMVAHTMDAMLVCLREESLSILEMRGLVDRCMDLVVGCLCVGGVETLYAFTHFKHIRSWTEHLILMNEDPETRLRASESILALCSLVDTCTDDREAFTARKTFTLEFLLLLLPIFTAIHANLRAGAKEDIVLDPLARRAKKNLSSSCREFHVLLCGMIKLVDVHVLAEARVGDLSLIEAFFRTAVQALMDHESLESFHVRTEDNLLIGIMRVLRTLIEKEPGLKGKSGELGLAASLYHDFLFSSSASFSADRQEIERIRAASSSSIATPPTQSRMRGMLRRSKSGQSIIFQDRSARCKTKASRDMALALLVELCRGNQTNMLTLARIFSDEGFAGCRRRDFQSRFAHEWNYNPLAVMKHPNQYTGLQNQGATCYNNSFLQQLFHIPSFSEAVLSVQNAPDSSLLYELQKVFGSLRVSTKHYYNSHEFCKLLLDESGQPVSLTEQKDANEYAIQVLDRIKTESAEGRTIVEKHFGGIQVSQVRSTNPDVPYVSEQVQDFLVLPLDIKNRASLHEALTASVQSDQFSDFKLDSGEVVDASRRVCFRQLPEVLMINLKRFGFHLQSSDFHKLNDYFEFPLLLNMEPFTYDYISRREQGELCDDQATEETSSTAALDLEDERFEYELVGILAHSGTLNSGHYFSFIRDRKSRFPAIGGEWIEFNDKFVWPYPVDCIPDDCFGGFNLVKNGDGSTSQIPKYRSAFILVYERKSSSGRPDRRSLLWSDIGNLETGEHAQDDILDQEDNEVLSDVEGEGTDIEDEEDSSERQESNLGWEVAAEKSNLDKQGIELLQHFMAPQKQHPSLRISRASDQSSMLKLPSHVVDAVLKENLTFIRHNNMFEAATFKFLWCCLTSALEDSSTENSEKLQMLLRATLEYVVDVGVHAWVPFLDGICPRWGPSLKKALARLPESCEWFLDFMSSVDRLDNVFRSCMAQNFAPLVQELVCTAITSLGRPRSRVVVTFMKRIVAHFEPSMLSLTTSPNIFAILDTFTSAGDDESEIIAEMNLMEKLAELYVNNVNIVRHDEERHVASCLLNVVQIVARLEAQQNHTAEETEKPESKIRVLVGKAKLWDKLITKDFDLSLEIIEAVSSWSHSHRKALALHICNTLKRKSSTVDESEIINFVRAMRTLLLLRFQGNTDEDLEVVRMVIPGLARQIIHVFKEHSTASKGCVYIFHISQMLIHVAARNSLVRNELLAEDIDFSSVSLRK